MKSSLPLFALAAAFAFGTLAFSIQETPQETPQESPILRWSIATQGPDGEVHVQEVDGPEVRAADGGTLTRGVAVRRASGVPGADLRQEVGALRRAVRVLLKHDHDEEARRLKEIADGLERGARAKGLNTRAERLLGGDVRERAVRVEMLDAIGETYELAGWETNAAAMRWMAELGRAQDAGEEPAGGPLPKAIAEADEPGMNAVVRIVRQGARPAREIGAERVVAMCEVLADYYVRRAAGEFQDEPEVAAEPGGLAQRERALRERIEALRIELEALRSELDRRDRQER